MADTTGEVTSVIRQAQQNAFNYGDEAVNNAFDYLEDAVNSANSVQWITYRSPPSQTINGPQTMQPFTKNDIPSIDSQSSAQYLNDWLEKYRLIINENFTKLFSFDMAEDLLEDILTNGYIVNRNINNQIISRAIDNELKKSNQLKDEALTLFVSRGYTIPDGVLNKQIQKINNDYSSAVSQVNRDIALKEEDLNTDMTKLALQEALRLKPQCIQIATDFASKYATMYNFGAENAKAYISGLGVVNDSINAFERNKTAIFSRELDEFRDYRVYDLQDRSAQVKLAMDQVEVKTRTSLSSADVVARIGQAALSAQTSITQLYAGTAT